MLCLVGENDPKMVQRVSCALVGDPLAKAGPLFLLNFDEYVQSLQIIGRGLHVLFANFIDGRLEKMKFGVRRAKQEAALGVVFENQDLVDVLSSFNGGLSSCSPPQVW